MNTIKTVIIHIILDISGIFSFHGTAGVCGFTRFVNFICRYVNTTVIAVNTMFFVANKSIPRKLWFMLPSSKASPETYLFPKL
ncbi:MAG: hypothetical protein BWY04_00417 [candidate division CPR1 bacterium ADurb.Bin160]|uniref:Uncharacterized protein n=1 Tax=candidate division CPR1 bacterium ADurb.Bin160 TaxID=1852826 RepID=A0A1V5ZQ48_9BACT|nr:MAG: hypothetical protein BWY04_00417 [candidate division CPR1 bacterium ADurb.Bin160]